jgi:hypothetical protein
VRGKSASAALRSLPARERLPEIEMNRNPMRTTLTSIRLDTDVADEAVKGRRSHRPSRNRRLEALQKVDEEIRGQTFVQRIRRLIVIIPTASPSQTPQSRAGWPGLLSYVELVQPI